MKTQKASVRISFYSVIMSFICLLMFYDESVFVNILIGIFASALLSFGMGICNYLTLRKEKAELLVVKSYIKNSESFGQLYKTNQDLTLEDSQKILGILSSGLYELYIINHEPLSGLFWFNKRATLKVQEIEKKIEDQIAHVSTIGFYIEYFEEDAKQKTKQIYRDLDKIIDDNSIYIKLLELNRVFGGEFHSIEENDKDDQYKKLLAEKYKEIL